MKKTLAKPKFGLGNSQAQAYIVMHLACTFLIAGALNLVLLEAR